jgi:hypothetical protein
VCQLVCERDILDRHLHIAQNFAAMLGSPHHALVLVEQCDHIDQRQILFVIAPGPRPIIQERQPVGIGVHHGQRLDQPLRVLMGFEDRLALGLGQKAGERAPLALRGVDRRRLFSPLIEGEHQTPVEQFLIDLRRRRGQCDHHRPLNAVLLGDQFAGGRILGGRGDGKLPFRLQQFERIARPRRALSPVENLFCAASGYRLMASSYVDIIPSA